MCRELLKWVGGGITWVLLINWFWTVGGELVSGVNTIGVIGGFFLLGLAGLLGVLGLVVSVRKLESLRCLLPVLLLLIPLSSCTKVEPGYVGILVNQYGSQRGVRDFPLVTGRVWYNPFAQDVYKFPTFLQSVVWTKDPDEGSPNDDSITFNSIEGAVLNFDIALSYGVEGAKVPELFIEYRLPAKDITHVYMRSKVRDAFSRIASSMKVTDIFGAGKQTLLDETKKYLQTTLGPKGFRFDMVSFIGAPRVDKRVEGSINAVIQATQRAIEAENKVRQATAEAQQKIETAKGTAESLLLVAAGQAEANRTVAASLTPGLIQWQGVQKWDGVLPRVTGTGGIPLIQLPLDK